MKRFCLSRIFIREHQHKAMLIGLKGKTLQISRTRHHRAIKIFYKSFQFVNIHSGTPTVTEQTIFICHMKSCKQFQGISRVDACLFQREIHFLQLMHPFFHRLHKYTIWYEKISLCIPDLAIISLTDGMLHYDRVFWKQLIYGCQHQKSDTATVGTPARFLHCRKKLQRSAVGKFFPQFDQIPVKISQQDIILVLILHFICNFTKCRSFRKIVEFSFQKHTTKFFLFFCRCMIVAVILIVIIINLCLIHVKTLLQFLPCFLLYTVASDHLFTPAGLVLIRKHYCAKHKIFTAIPFSLMHVQEDGVFLPLPDDALLSVLHLLPL